MFYRMTFDRDNQLRCPRCNDNYLHHVTTQVFTREEDADYVDVTTVGPSDCTQVRFRNDETANPSNRRHGILIHFYCEVCSEEDRTDDLVLAIAQHKGETYMGWKF